MRKSCPSDITREQFEVIRLILSKATKATHPRKYDLYDIFRAVLYLSRRDVRGGRFRMIIQNGKMCAIIMIFGQSRTKQALSVGLWNTLSDGLTNAADFGKIARDFSTIPFIPSDDFPCLYSSAFDEILNRLLHP